MSTENKEKKINSLGEIISLYIPALLGVVAVIISMYNWHYGNIVEALHYSFLAATVLTVMALHRIHEYKHGWTVDFKPKREARIATFSIGIALSSLALSYSSVPLALAGSALMIGAVAYNN